LDRLGIGSIVNRAPGQQGLDQSPIEVVGLSAPHSGARLRCWLIGNEIFCFGIGGRPFGGWLRTTS